jgi:hypothetical protein
MEDASESIRLRVAGRETEDGDGSGSPRADSRSPTLLGGGLSRSGCWVGSKILFKLGVREGETSEVGGLRVDATMELVASEEGASAVGSGDGGES